MDESIFMEMSRGAWEDDCDGSSGSGLRCSSISTFPSVGFCFLSASALPAFLIPARQTERFNLVFMTGMSLTHDLLTQDLI